MTEQTKKDLEAVFVVIDAFVGEGIKRHFVTDIQPIDTLEERASENTRHIQNLQAQAESLKYRVFQWAEAYEAKGGDVK